jgi:protein-S-isoprenylcysteine O-methyltransferase Ste14
MSTEALFRWLFIIIFLAVFSISGYFRRRARRSGEIIARTREGGRSVVLRGLFAAALYLPMLAYMIRPSWMAWSAIPLPGWLRWLGAVVGAVMVPALYWVMTSLGRNVSETVLTKRDHQLVKEGPYRSVRHPLYAVATVALISLGLLAANWYLILMAVLAIAWVLLIVVPREEGELVKKFGDEYREYQHRTGRLLPRLNVPADHASQS